MIISGAERPYIKLFGAPNGHNLLIKWPFDGPRRTAKVQKWASDAYPVKIGQLEQYVVFRTKSGSVQDSQWGERCLIGVKQSPMDPIFTSFFVETLYVFGPTLGPRI